MLIKTVPGKLQLGAKQAILVGTILRSRISKGESLSLIGPETNILFEAGEAPAVVESDKQVTLTVNTQIVEELVQNLRPVEGTFEIASLDHMLVQIVKTEIKTRKGTLSKRLDDAPQIQSDPTLTSDCAGRRNQTCLPLHLPHGTRSPPCASI